MNKVSRVGVNGVELNVFQDGSGPPILFVHGFPLHHAMWEAQLQEFGGTHRVIAPDLRGLGGSDITEGTVTMEQFADDLNGLLDTLGIEEPVVLCGLSMGGYVAWEFVRKYGDRLRALILCDTRAGADAPDAAENRRKLARSVLDSGVEPVVEAILPKLLSESTTAHRPSLVERLREMIRSNPPAGIAAASLGMAARADSSDLLERIRVPTLLIVGRDDTISPMDEMRRMADRIDGAELVVIPNAGHMAPMEDPEAVNAAIRHFWAELSA